MSHELRITEDSTMARTDARWFRLECADPLCDTHIEARIAPAAGGDALIEAFRQAHAQLVEESA